MKVAKAVLKLYGYHLFLLFILTFVIYSLWFIADSFPIFFCCFMSFIYGCMIYSVGWNYGKKDGRKIPGSYPDPRFAILVSVFASIIPVCLFLFKILSPQLALVTKAFLPAEQLQSIASFIFRLWFFPFGDFIDRGGIIISLLVVLVLPVLFISGYFVGLRRFKLLDLIMEKLLYSTSKAKKNE